MEDCAGGFFSTSDWESNDNRGGNGTSSSTSPERRLLLAILERAILDYVGNDSREVEAAEEWLFNKPEQEIAEPTPTEQFSFSWVCEQLDLDTLKVARKIRSMPRRGNRRVAPWYFAKEVVHA
jgi:hypothetical protein